MIVYSVVSKDPAYGAALSLSGHPVALVSFADVHISGASLSSF